MTQAPGSFPGQADLETVLLHAADAITVQASDGSLVFANLAAARTLGFDSPEALLATPIRELMSHFDLLDEHGSPLPLDQLPSRRALAGQSGPPSVVRFRDVASGDDHWSLVQAMPIVDEAGAVRLVINTFQDVSQLKRTEQQLRLLADAGAVLGRSVDYQEALQELADLVGRQHRGLVRRRRRRAEPARHARRGRPLGCGKARARGGDPAPLPDRSERSRRRARRHPNRQPDRHRRGARGRVAGSRA